MAAKWTNYFKIIDKQVDVSKAYDSQNLSDPGSYNNFSWYQRLIHGSTSRLAKYREYDLMDADVEIFRALDTIGEEMTGNNPKTNEPIEVEVIAENDDRVKSYDVLTVKAALRRWSQLHKWDNRLFKIARHTAKYGDCFFRKQKDYEKWIFIHPKNVMAAIVDSEDINKVIGWQVREDIEKARQGGMNMPLNTGGKDSLTYELIPADEMVWFTLNDDMSDTAPFGESILNAVYKTHKQKELLEDAIIIYRVQRSPERRVFYIDVGKMPPQRVKQYLETIKNEIKQKKIPSINGGQSEVDSVYNPQSMSEDFYFACLSMKTKVYLLDGRTLTIDELRQEYEEGKENWTYSVDQKTGKLIAGKIDWAGYTRKNAEIVRVLLDNGKTIDCTPDHKFVLHDGSEVEAQFLTPDMSLMPIYKKLCKTNKNQKESLYERIIDNSTGKWKFTHLEICPKINDLGSVIHHKDYNPKNNYPNNLVELSHAEHWKQHHSVNGHTFGRLWSEDREGMIASIKSYYTNMTEEQKQSLILRNRENGRNTWLKNEHAVRDNLKRGTITNREKFKSEEEYCAYMSNIAKLQWTDDKKKIRSQQVKTFNVDTKSYVIDDTLYSLFIDIFNSGNNTIHKIKQALVNSKKFIEYFKKINSNNQNVKNNKKIIFGHKFIYKLVNFGGYDNFQNFKQNYAFNHKIVSVTWLDEHEDTGCLHVVDENNNHNFALEAGVYVKNSRPDGRGSKVEVLPGGANLGQLEDLDYFQRKVWRGLKVPASYMIEQQEGGQLWNDGKVGIAYIQELRFALFIIRLQRYIEETLDKEFKIFLRKVGITVDHNLYKLRLPEPSNFGKYRQMELDSQLLGQFGTADSIQYLSKRFALKKYLNLSDQEILINERMLREEKQLDVNGDAKDYPMLYGAGDELGMAGGMGGIGGIGGAPMPMIPGDELGMEGGEGAIPTEEPPPSE